MKANKGTISLKLRFRLAQKAFEHTAVYDRMISDYLNSQDVKDVEKCFEF